SGRHRDGSATGEERAIPPEQAVRRHRDKDVEVARLAAPQPRLAFAREANAGAILDSGRYRHRERLLLVSPARALAAPAGRRNGPAGPLAGGAGALEGEETLLRTDPSRAAAGRASDRLGTTLATTTLASLADDRRRDPHRRLLAGERLLEGDGQIVAEV